MLVAGAVTFKGFKERARIVKDLEKKFRHKGIRINVEDNAIVYNYNENEIDGFVLI